MSASPDIETLIARLARLPGLGPRSARRAALALLQQPEKRLRPLAEAMETAARTVQTCTTCGNLDSQNPCALCRDETRARDVVCVVENVGALWALERSGAYRGQYQVLGGTLSPLAGTGPEDLNVAGLKARVASGDVREIILALGATVEGATTAHWLQSQLQPGGQPSRGRQSGRDLASPVSNETGMPVKISRLGQGMPMGGALDVLDDGTLTAALTARRDISGDVSG